MFLIRQLLKFSLEIHFLDHQFASFISNHPSLRHILQLNITSYVTEKLKMTASAYVVNTGTERNEGEDEEEDDSLIRLLFCTFVYTTLSII